MRGTNEDGTLETHKISEGTQRRSYWRRRGRDAVQVLMNLVGEPSSFFLVRRPVGRVEGLGQAIVLWPGRELWSTPLVPHPWSGQ